jgi:hypothetical protein
VTLPRDLVTELVTEGRLERIARDQSAVQRTLAQASMNLQGAEQELQAGNAGSARLRPVGTHPTNVADPTLGVRLGWLRSDRFASGAI